MLGGLRFGWLLNLVSSPVLMAFTQAAAVLIISSQWGALVGWRGGWPVHWPSLAFGVGSIALLVGVRRWKPAFPSV